MSSNFKYKGTPIDELIQVDNSTYLDETLSSSYQNLYKENGTDAFVGNFARFPSDLGYYGSSTRKPEVWNSQIEAFPTNIFKFKGSSKQFVESGTRPLSTSSNITLSHGTYYLVTTSSGQATLFNSSQSPMLNLTTDDEISPKEVIIQIIAGGGGGGAGNWGSSGGAGGGGAMSVFTVKIPQLPGSSFDLYHALKIYVGERGQRGYNSGDSGSAGQSSYIERMYNSSIWYRETANGGGGGIGGGGIGGAGGVSRTTISNNAESFHYGRYPDNSSHGGTGGAYHDGYSLNGERYHLTYSTDISLSQIIINDEGQEIQSFLTSAGGVHIYGPGGGASYGKGGDGGAAFAIGQNGIDGSGGGGGPWAFGGGFAGGYGGHGLCKIYF